MSRKRSWVKRICKCCEKEFELVPYKVRLGGGKFCSRECYQEWHRGANHSGWTRLTKICEICGKEFTVKRSLVTKGKGRFCSRRCQSIWQSKTKGSQRKTERKSEPHEKARRISKTHRVPKVCEKCGKEFTVILSEAKRGGGRFCSRECMNQYQRGSNHPQWKGGRFRRPSSGKNYYSGHKTKLSRPGFVYLLHADNGLYKIGRTTRVLKRIMRLGIELPYELKLAMIIQSEDMYWLETELHQRFAEKRKRGEWFELNQENLEHIKRFALALIT